MPGVQFDTLFRHARCLGGPGLDALTDRQLLGRFATRGDGDAFARLVGRHGAMVFGICRRLLRDHHAAEDAFQAVFLVLARRAGSVGWRESAGGWLYEVAHRVAAKALCQAARQRTREKEAASMRSERVSAAEGRDEVDLLHEELRRLPEKYRLPVVLCFLEGMSHVEAASQLGWPLGTVKGRLARARDLLKRRLARRGMVLTAPVLVALLGRGAAAAPPAALAHSTTRAALAFASGSTPAALPEGSLALARDVLRTIRPAPLGLSAVLVLALGLLCGAAVLTGRPASEPRQDPPPSSEKSSPAQKIVEDEPLPAGAVQRLGSLRSFRPGGRVNQAAFSPDGKVLALVGQRTLGLWDATTGREVRRLHEGGEMECIAFSADGKRLLSGSYPFQDARLWDATTGKELRVFTHAGTRVHCVAITADGKTIAVGCEDHIIYLWDAESGKKRATLKGHENDLFALAFAPDGHTLASAGVDMTARLWEVSSGRELHRLKAPALPGYRGWVFGVAFSPDGKSVASANGDGIVRVWETATGKERLALKGHTDDVGSVVFAPDGKRLISGSSDNTIRIWDARTGKELRRIAGSDQKKGLQRIALSPDGKTLASWGGTHTIRLWDIASGKERLHSRGHQAEVVQVRFAPDGRTLLSWGRDLTVRHWDLRTGTERCVAAGTNWFTYDDGIAFSPDRKLLAMASGDGTVGLWETDTGRKLRALTGHKRALTAVAFTPEGRMLASASIDRTIRIWDVAEGKERKRWPVTAEEVRPLVFSPDGKLLAWAAEENVIHLWSAESGKEVRRFEGHAGGPLDNGFFARPTLIVFAPDGRTVLTSRRNDPALRLWEVTSGKELRQLQQPELVTGSNGGLIAAGFSPTGRVGQSAGSTGGSSYGKRPRARCCVNSVATAMGCIPLSSPRMGGGLPRPVPMASSLSGT